MICVDIGLFTCEYILVCLQMSTDWFVYRWSQIGLFTGEHRLVCLQVNTDWFVYTWTQIGLFTGQHGLVCLQVSTDWFVYRRSQIGLFTGEPHCTTTAQRVWVITGSDRIGVGNAPDRTGSELEMYRIGPDRSWKCTGSDRIYKH